MATKYSSPETFLMQQDKKLKKLISIFGWANIGKDKREPFDGLARAVIGQQLSTAAANWTSPAFVDIPQLPVCSCSNAIGLS
jgi:3-methyladenine DNA glycosylase/8-oxoguanine DNA glycosylase